MPGMLQLQVDFKAKAFFQESWLIQMANQMRAVMVWNASTLHF
jgi:hypothetical protein